MSSNKIEAMKAFIKDAKGAPGPILEYLHDKGNWSWNDVCWVGVGTFGKRSEKRLFGHQARKHAQDNPMDSAFIDFAKACVVVAARQKFGATKSALEGCVAGVIAALKAVEQCLPDPKNPWAINAGVLRNANTFLKNPLDTNGLARLVDIIVKADIVDAGLANYNVSHRKIQHRTESLDPEAVKARESKLLTAYEVEAIGRAFMSEKTDMSGRARWVLSVIGLLMCAPSRISEVLKFGIHVLQEKTVRGGESRYVFSRFSPGKGGEHQDKPLAPQSVELAKMSIERLLDISSPARKLIKHLEGDKKHLFYRHPGCPNVGEDDPLSREQITSALGYELFLGASQFLGFRVSEMDDQRWTLRKLWKYVLQDMEKRRLIPGDDGKYYVDSEKETLLSESLCVRLYQSNSATKPNPFRIVIPSADMFASAVNGESSIFSQLDCKDENGEILKINSHAIRHLLNTIAQQGGISEGLIATWSGRADIRQNRVYDHRPLKDRGASLRESRDLESIKIRDPITYEEMDALIKENSVAYHHTPTGMCITDESIMPCLMHATCVSCNQMCAVKGDCNKRQNIESEMKRAEQDAKEAMASVKDGVKGSRAWLETAELRLKRCKQFLNIMDNDDIPDGSLVWLAGGIQSIHHERARHVRLEQAKLKYSNIAFIDVYSDENDANDYDEDEDAE